MSAYITVYIERSKARQFIIERVMTMSDKELEDVMDDLLRGRLENCIIVPDGWQEHHD